MCSRCLSNISITIAGVCEDKLYRVLRAAVQIGLFQAVQPKKGESGVSFKNNKRSALLREGHPNCLKNMVRLLASETHYSLFCVDQFPSAFVDMLALMLASPLSKGTVVSSHVCGASEVSL